MPIYHGPLDFEKVHHTIQQAAIAPLPDKPTPRPYVGADVFYVLPPESNRRGQLRPAKIVSMLGKAGRASLCVFIDGPHDFRDGPVPMGESIPVRYVHEAEYGRYVGKAPVPGTWVWPDELPESIGE